MKIIKYPNLSIQFKNYRKPNEIIQLKTEHDQNTNVVDFCQTDARVSSSRTCSLEWTAIIE